VGTLVEPYKEFSWLFVSLDGKESTSCVPKYVFYVLHESIRVRINFDWAEIISNEVSHHLFMYEQTKRFFMTSYLVYAIVYCHLFEGLTPRKDVNYEEDLVQIGTMSSGDTRHPSTFTRSRTLFLEDADPLSLGEVSTSLQMLLGTSLWEKVSITLRKVTHISRFLVLKEFLSFYHDFLSENSLLLKFASNT
jgi:hypothetical protein